MFGKVSACQAPDRRAGDSFRRLAEISGRGTNRRCRRLRGAPETPLITMPIGRIERLAIENLMISSELRYKFG